MAENRKKETLNNIFEKYIEKKSIIISDDYPSYPPATRMFGSIHKVVNHKVGFVNEEGYTTNSIEIIWSHLKKDYRERAGLSKERIPVFLKEFEWKKKALKNKAITDFESGFSKIVNYMIKI